MHCNPTSAEGHGYIIVVVDYFTKWVEAVDVFVTSECIHLCILCIVTRCLFQDVSIMYLSHVVMPRCFDREDQ